MAPALKPVRKTTKQETISKEGTKRSRSAPSEPAPNKRAGVKKAATGKTQTTKNKLLPSPSSELFGASSAVSPTPSDIRLLQVAAQGVKVEPPFESYDVRSSKALKRLKLASLPGNLIIYNVIRLARHDPVLRNSSVWGLLPTDFDVRTQLTGAELEAQIRANPGFDLYYCSANPEVEAAYHNAWCSPAVTYPDFIRISRAFLKAAGIGESPVDAVSHSALFATGNLIVASPAFWDRYIEFVDQSILSAASRLPPSIAEPLFAEVATAGRMTHLSLIVARLLGVFLMLKEADFKAFKIPLVRQEKALNPHLRLLREMKDIGLENRSRWHLAAWLNYRALYLAHVMGKQWVIEHIERVTPKLAISAVPVAEVVSPYPRTVQAEVRP